MAGLAARMFHGLSVVPVVTADGQLVAVPGGSATRSLSWVQAVCQGQFCGRCRVSRRAEAAIRHGMWISLRRTVAVVARARSEAAAGAARVAVAETAGCLGQCFLNLNPPIGLGS